MRILVVSQYYYPENFRINDICEALVDRGHKVTVLTGLPNYPSGIIPKEYRHGKKRKEVINGVNIIRVFEIARGKNGIQRILNYLSFMVCGQIKAKSFDVNAFDIIYGYAPSPIMQMMAALEYKKRSNKKILFYCCDIWPEALKGSISENSMSFKWAKRVSKKVYDECDLTQVTSRPFIDYIHSEHNIPLNKLVYLPQHAEDDYLSMDFTAEDNGCIDFLFAGNVGTVQDMDCIISASVLLKDLNNWKIHIVGDGSYLETVKKLVKNNNLEDKYVFHGRYPLKEMPKFYKIADACLLTLKCDTAVGLTMPSKLQGYMAAGKTVIGAINGAAKEVIEESGCGICVNSSDSKALAEAMRKFIHNPEQYKDCGNKGREYFMTHFTKKIFMDSLESTLINMAEKGE